MVIMTEKLRVHNEPSVNGMARNMIIYPTYPGCLTNLYGPEVATR